MVQGMHANGGSATLAYMVDRDAASKKAGFQSLQRQCSKSTVGAFNDRSTFSKPAADKNNCWGRFENTDNFKRLHNY